MNFHNTMSLLLSPWFDRTRHSLIAIIPRCVTFVCDFYRNYRRDYGGYVSVRIKIKPKKWDIIMTLEREVVLISYELPSLVISLEVGTLGG